MQKWQIRAQVGSRTWEEESKQPMHLPGVWVPGSLGAASLPIQYGKDKGVFSNPESSFLHLFNKSILNSYRVPRFVPGTRGVDEKTGPLLLRSSQSWQDIMQRNDFGAKPSVFQEACSGFPSQIPFLRAPINCTIC